MSLRRELLRSIPRKRELEDLKTSAGYAWLPAASFSALPAVLELAQKLYEDKRPDIRPDLGPFRGADLLAAARYEEAPAFFDLALSDEILQITCDYMGEIPTLQKPRLWWTNPVDPSLKLTGTQLYHRGRPDAPNIRRQAKFLFTMNDVDEKSGPFTFIPADLSEKIMPYYRMGERVSDDEMYKLVRPSDAITHIGPPGTGLFVDTMRCFHYGRRASFRERLMLMIQFMKHDEAPEEDWVEQSPGFVAKFGDDPVRRLAMTTD